MQFLSDNCGPVHPQVMAAIAAANTSYTASYGNDPVTVRAQNKLRQLFEAPDASVSFVGTGSAANSLILSLLCKPWEVIFCADLSHIYADECNAVEMFGGGVKLHPLQSTQGKVTPDVLEAAILAQSAGDVHRPQPGVLSITQLTECGTVYTLDEIRALTDIAHTHGMRTHMDGARFANALAALGCNAADMSWRAGIDAVSFGGTKNGLMGAEACILFDPSLQWELDLRRKRATHLFSKHRYLAAQMDAALTDGLWLELASQANASAQRLASGLNALSGVTLDYPAQGNMIFLYMDDRIHDALASQGLIPVRHGNNMQVRLVCDWAVSPSDVDHFLAVAATAAEIQKN